jgi:signal transduction histidine kinase
VAIAVRNEGPPISEERRTQLFEPLSAVASRNKDNRQAPHLGLGLYIANTIVIGHGGRVDVESEAGRGTTFTFHLPKGGAAGEDHSNHRQPDDSQPLEQNAGD